VATVYVASALGFSAATRPYNDTLLAALRDAGHVPHDPWSGPPPDGTAAGNARVAEANFAAIRDADAVLALLDGPDVDSGVAAEIGYAYALGKRVIGLRLDFRRSGDNDAAPVNLQVHHCLAAPLATTLEDAVASI
jgi:nucleoside 2-deoxyribosyltransferase